MSGLVGYGSSDDEEEKNQSATGLKVSHAHIIKGNLADWSGVRHLNNLPHLILLRLKCLVSFYENCNLTLLNISRDRYKWPDQEHW